MIPDPFILLISVILFVIYAVIFVITVIFTFFPLTYHKIDEKLKIELISARILNPLEQNINWLDNWLISHNKTVGVILIALCIVDIKFSFAILSMP